MPLTHRLEIINGYLNLVFTDESRHIGNVMIDFKPEYSMAIIIIDSTADKYISEMIINSLIGFKDEQRISSVTSEVQEDDERLMTAFAKAGFSLAQQSPFEKDGVMYLRLIFDLTTLRIIRN